MSDSTRHSLSNAITAFQQEMLPQIPEEVLTTMQAAITDLQQSGLENTAKKTGDNCPDFTLPNANNEAITLSSLLEKGPVVISFYRGAWCPYCNLEINALQASLDAIQSQGASLLAITPQTPDKSHGQIKEKALTFEILSDKHNTLARQFGLVFTLPEALRPVYADWGIDVPGHNGDDTFELPVPATYIVGQDMTIKYTFVNVDYTQRLEPDIIIEQLAAI